MVAELNEVWGELAMGSNTPLVDSKTTSNCDKIMEHIKNCPECQQKLKNQQKQQVMEKFQNQPVQQAPRIQKVQKVQKIQQPEDIDLVEKFFEYSDIILIGLTIYLILKAL